MPKQGWGSSSKKGASSSGSKPDEKKLKSQSVKAANKVGAEDEPTAEKVQPFFF